MAACDVCFQDRPDVKWCSICQANICRSCRPKYLKRIRAALDRR